MHSGEAVYACPYVRLNILGCDFWARNILHNNQNINEDSADEDEQNI
jgi:hypothetical protein